MRFSMPETLNSLDAGRDHKVLVTLAVRWIKRRCSIVFPEFSSAAGEAPDAIGWKGGLSALIECKFSRADFLRDSKNRNRSVPLCS